MTALTPLRHIYVSGGFFTENLLLRLRDKPDDYEETKWASFGAKWQEARREFEDVWEWVKLTYDAVLSKLDSWSVQERFNKWIGPLLRKLGHNPEQFPHIDSQSKQDQPDGDENILENIKISHRMKNNVDPLLHICTEIKLDERVDINYQKKSQHDHLQRYLLLNTTNSWGFLTNGHVLRLLGEYSNVYSKGYIEFDLENIIINRDELEFRIFYCFTHVSRFDTLFGLEKANWMKNLDKELQKQKPPPQISPEILTIYDVALNQLLAKAQKLGTSTIISKDSQFFFNLISENKISLEPNVREVFAKQLENITTGINQNECILKRLQEKSANQGVEIGKKLRENVRAALELLGEGLIQSSPDFSRDVRIGTFDIRDFFQELLRITYRLIFTLYAESKKILPDINTLYYQEVGLSFIRQLAEQPIRNDQNLDLWYRLQLLFRFMDGGNKEIGINAFSGPLFDIKNTPILEKYHLTLANSELLRIILQLTIVETEDGRQKINYAEVGEEEIGGIYESLLDFIPRYVQKDSAVYHFILESIETERKESGSYYTPKGLIDILLKSALLPVVEKKLEGAKTKVDLLSRLLEIKICDPACGGGSFLLATLDYLGNKYAQIDRDQEFPDDDTLRESRRKILQHCIYGVDLNPMAIELAKMSLWLKACVKDKPLTFLDNHLKTGDSLIGFAKKQKIETISLNAFNATKGNSETGVADEDQKLLVKVRKVAKNYSKSSRSTGIQQSLLIYQTPTKLTQPADQVFEMDESTLEKVKKKIQCYNNLKQTKTWEYLNLQANTWTSAFFWEMRKDFGNNIPSDELIQRIKLGNVALNEEITSEINRLAKLYHFFNWYLEFPEVFRKEDSGFDCILMNPPWEILLLKEMEFFAGRAQNVEATKSQADRRSAILALKQINPSLHAEYENEWRKLKKFDFYLRESSLYNNTARGSINTYAIFCERAISLLSNEGRFGVIIPTGLVTNFNMQDFFKSIIEKQLLISLFDFKNELKLFPIDQRIHFSLLTIGIQKQQDFIPMAFSCHNPLKVQEILSLLSDVPFSQLEKRMSDEDQLFFLNGKDFELFNPNTLTCPVFQKRKDVLISRRIYSQIPVLIKRNRKDTSIEKNDWIIDFFTMFHMSNDSGKFYNESDLNQAGAHLKDPHISGGYWIQDANTYLPLYDGKMIWLYDHRYNSVEYAGDGKKRKSRSIQVSNELHKNPAFSAIPQFWVNETEVKQRIPSSYTRKWFLGFRNITGPFAERSFICTIIPYSAIGNAIPLILTNIEPKLVCCLMANLNSFIFDYIVRLKITGNNMNYYLFEQFPVLPPSFYSEKIVDIIFPRVFELIYTSYDLTNFAIDCNHNNKPFEWNVDRRAILQAELDVIFAFLYGITYDEFDYILTSFQLLEKYETKDYGEFRSKRIVLDTYNRFMANPELKSLLWVEDRK